MAVNDDPHVLIVAGSDSSGGAGIARDVETIAAFGLRACLAVTAVTVQTHKRVDAIKTVAPQLVAAQMRAALCANHVAAIKIGMLGSGETIGAVAAVLRSHRHVPFVLDPVLASTSGGTLLPAEAVDHMRRKLLPLSAMVTPNLCELAVLAESVPATTEAEMVRQGRSLLRTGCASVLIKGGHTTGPRATDILLRPDHAPIHLHAPRLERAMRGTGCMLASAIAANLASGESAEKSAENAKRATFAKLAQSTREPWSHGRAGPLKRSPPDAARR